MIGRSGLGATSTWAATGWWCGRNTLGKAGRERIRAISMDMTRIYGEVARIHLPQAAICYDAFHLIKWAGEALDQVHLAAPRDGTPIQVDGLSPAKTWQKVRSTLRAAAENLDPTGKAVINQLRIKQKQLHRAWQLNRRLYQGLSDKAAAKHLDKWCRAATRSDINAFMTLSRRIRHHFDGIIAAITHRLSNSRIEGINAGIRLIQRRANGYASHDKPHRSDPHLPRRRPDPATNPPIGTEELAHTFEKLSYPVDSVLV